MPISRTDFLSQIETAKPGTKIIYHTGSVMADRQIGQTFLTVNAVAAAAYDAYLNGQVTLVQKTLAPGIHDYIAIKRAPNQPKPTHMQRHPVGAPVERQRAHA